MKDKRNQIIEIYHSARELHGEERSQFLQDACGSDTELLRQIQTLLEQDETANSLLDRPAISIAAELISESRTARWPPGTQVGPYELLSLVGIGGMGEVYRARDKQLQRDVALKLLPKIFASDPERLARFQREAQVLAALNHPNIAQIYGLEGTGTSRCIVMELVEGETFEERLTQGPLPVKEALVIAQQIAEALEAAHEKNIVHRDLKPANVKVTPDGKVKVLDFGLAKAFAPDQAAADLSTGRTMSGTEEGRILGTPGYMSPEQARGKQVDSRTDVWSFGCLLYELLTGEHAFDGDTLSDIIVAVLEREPDWKALPASIPARVVEILRRCFQKDIRRRLQAIGDARIEIEEAIADAKRLPAADRVGAQPRTPARNLRKRVVLTGVAGVILAFIAGFLTSNLKPSTPSSSLPVSRFTITLPEGQQLGNSFWPSLAISPDGSRLVYAAVAGVVQQLYLRVMDSGEVRPLPGTEGAVTPFFSPDGQWLGFFSGGKLQKVPVSGGALTTLGFSDSRYSPGASWSSQGMIAFTPLNGAALQRVSQAAGGAQLLTRLEKGEQTHRWPSFLPDGKALLFNTSPNPANQTNARIVVQSIQTVDRKNLVEGATQPAYAPPGYLVYAQDGTLMAAPFDVGRLTLTGAAVPVVEGVLQSPTTGAAHYSFSNSGTLVYASGGIYQKRFSLVWVNRNGSEEPLAAPPHPYYHPRISPDGRRVAVGILEQGNHVWIYDLALDKLTRLTFEGTGNNFPAWTPDGKRIAFRSARGSGPNIFWQPADGSSGWEQLTTNNAVHPSSFSPDGQFLAFSGPPGPGDIWMLRFSDRKAQPFLQTRFLEGDAQFSPDGHWLAYVSNESGRFEIYVQTYPASGGKWQISTEGGTEAVWNPNGRELFYRSGNKMMAVDVTTQPTFSAGKPRTLFEGPYEPAPADIPNYSISADGQRFLMSKPIAEQPVTQINVVVNWFTELQRRVPVK